ncbi:MAG: hypothetical protein GTN75_05865 [Gemmatimonadetes bacterium]|nr:hypothetical protein [Gemmatimonadota bacterium]
MNDQQKAELEFRKFEYELVNGKINLNVARLDKLWISLAGTDSVCAAGLRVRTLKRIRASSLDSGSHDEESVEVETTQEGKALCLARNHRASRGCLVRRLGLDRRAVQSPIG